MRRATFPEGVLVALAAALGGSIAHTVMPGAVGPDTTIRLIVAGLGLGYALYLLRRSPSRTGRVVTLAAWFSIAVLGWFLIDDRLTHLAVHLGLLWLVRTLHHQSGVLAAVLDLGLNLAALMAGTWAFVHSGSVFLGIWSFFLVQALFVIIPMHFARPQHDGAEPSTAPDRFQLAYRSAENALRELADR